MGDEATAIASPKLTVSYKLRRRRIDAGEKRRQTTETFR
jgi:hypothetical protein